MYLNKTYTNTLKEQNSAAKLRSLENQKIKDNLLNI